MVNLDRQSTLVPKQRALDAANVLIIGCGAIGSVVAPILVRMGVGTKGTITLADGDTVEDSNLNRQFFGTEHIGMNKALAVALQMKAVNSQINVETFPSYMKVEDIDFGSYDVIIFTADSLFFEGQVYKALLTEKRQPAFLSPRMTGWSAELFVRIQDVCEPTAIYFNDKPDKKYGEGATCTAPNVEEKKIPAIATTTNILAGLTAQAFVHVVQGWQCRPHVRIDFRRYMEGEVVQPEAQPKKIRVIVPETK